MTAWSPLKCDGSMPVKIHFSTKDGKLIVEKWTEEIFSNQINVIESTYFARSFVVAGLIRQLYLADKPLFFRGFL